MNSWRPLFRNPGFRKQFFISVLLLLTVLSGFFFILAFIEQRHGFRIEAGWMDAVCRPYDLSVYIFPLTWPVAFVGVTLCIRHPPLTLLLMRAYFLLLVLRSITLLAVTLDPPQGIIPLNDPFLHSTFYNGRANLKDLFFSGHVATIMLFVFILRGRLLKAAFLFIAVVLGILIAIQRVHYLTDIAAAPLFAFLAYAVAKRWNAATLPLPTPRHGNSSRA